MRQEQFTGRVLARRLLIGWPRRDVTEQRSAIGRQQATARSGGGEQGPFRHFFFLHISI